MRAPVEHIFGCHEWCDKEWCWSKELEDTKLNITKKLQIVNNNGGNKVSD